MGKFGEKAARRFYWSLVGRNAYPTELGQTSMNAVTQFLCDSYGVIFLPPFVR